MKQCTCADSYIVANRSLSCSIHGKSVMKSDFDLKELENRWPDAYKALPEAYKADSCLIFFIDVNGHLCAQNDSGNQYMWINDHRFTNPSTFWAQIG